MKNPGYKKFYILLMILLVSITFGKNKNADWPIITRKGDQLYEGDKVFRFMGLAAPNIQQNESQIRKDRTNRFPDEYEIRDILEALNRLGSRATRPFSLSVYSPDDDNMPVYIPARRTYNEDAFQCLDRIIALGHEYDVRLIIPFIASQSFGGIRGVDEFAALAGKAETGAFWTDEEVKADFRHFLEFILNRKNTVNGIMYKNDPAILAWQFGNEFGSFAGDRGLDYAIWTPHILNWCNEMADYIKEIDPNHLIIEAGGLPKEEMLKNPNVDIISEHYYEYWNRLGGRPWQLAPLAREMREMCKGKKPLIIDEFGLGTYDNIKELMVTIREENIVGGLMWSIRGRRRDGGWYYHNEGGTSVNSYHYPGFTAGFTYEESRFLELVKAEAWKIRGLKIPVEKVPTPAPVLMQQGDGFTWRGSAGAAFYVMERAESKKGKWQIIATGLHDSVLQNVKDFEHTEAASEPLVLYSDATKEPGKRYYYRLKAVNIAGESECSDILEIGK
ncbi:MAG: cellulase family glycosylhydrolase [Candidatus Marinimicrobia bacterium]|nr:cellulase family glycosylhydrolase [Candidatus Neomarinimicrobiota bacterium]